LIYDIDSCNEQIFEFNAAGEKQGKGNAKLRTRVPRRQREKIMVSEIIHLADAFTETPNKQMSLDIFWGVLKNVTTVLEAGPGQEDDNIEASAGRSHGEMVLVKVNQELMQNSPNKNERPDEVAEGTKLDQMAWFQ
jgi:hypothetical protein